ncbi:MAG: aldose 1-epimerase [Chitinophagaceae bacterium]|nr:MAG: aldose 1-epimerase [Chitinophagaceae bacterium]
MFSVDTKEVDGFDIIVLANKVAGTSIEIIPACGAILHGFWINCDGVAVNIIEPYTTKADFDNQVESRGFRGCKLSPFVCRLKDGKYEFGEKDYKVEKFYLGKHALHGLLYDAAFEVIKIKAVEEMASAELLFSYKGTDRGFPFKYDCRVVYELKKDNNLHITTIVKNQESFAIPMSDGWHPYFTFGRLIDELQLGMQAESILVADEELIPSGKKLPYSLFKTATKIGPTVFDDCFLVDFKQQDPTLILIDPKKKLQLEIRPDRSYPYLQIYTPGHRRSIAIENLSAAPDAFNNRMGLTTLPAGNEAIYKTNFRISNTG